MNQKEVLKELENKLNYKGCSPDTINTYQKIASRFLKTTKNDPPNSKDIQNYILRLKKEGRKPNYLRFNYYVISRIYKTMDWDGLTGPPNLPDETIERKIFSKDDIIKLIESTKVKGTDQEKAFLAASTIWGLRRSEIIKIKPEDIEDNKILIHTRKGGLDRKHQIPNEIRPYIYNYDWKDRVSSSRANVLFEVILYKANFNLADYNGYSWHAIRRALVTQLVMDGMSEMKVHHFLRWKTGKSIVYTYARLPDKDIEEEIYKKHPYLYAWK